MRPKLGDREGDLWLNGLEDNDWAMKLVSFYINLYGAYARKYYQPLFWSVFGPTDRYWREYYLYA